MKKLCSILTVIMLLALCSCIKKPTADVTVDKTTATVGETITATSASTNANTYLWGVFDGDNVSGGNSSNYTTISGGSPCDATWSFSISVAGTYTLRLKVCNFKNGCDGEEDSSGYCDDVLVTLTIQ